MADILIKGIQFPKFSPHVIEVYPDGTAIARKGIYGKAVPVPPHGRLIDADSLMLRIQEYIDEYGWDVDEHGFHSEKWCAMKETEMAINDAPTVIPADKDGE